MPAPRKRLVAPLGLAVAATTLVLVPAPANAAPVDITLLNFNDFHGRINGDTTKFATTIEQIRAAAGDDQTLLLSAGDNIGASLFASSNQEDVPTLDVLDALDLAGSAVGNHEFDRGFADLRDRVQAAADFDYLGANVYLEGTETPALEEYATYEVGGVTVGVIGAVTEDTASLVSPGGIADIEFGDPVAAVNRVAAELTDGQAANGEADVIVAEYHEGAADQNAPIVTETSPEVDVIFTGHTHAEYAFEAPVPGEAGRTRPIVQAGSYGENLGRVDLVVDDATGEVTAATAAIVPVVEEVTTEDLALPRVAAVKQIVDAAIEAAEEVGNVKVGEITEDITRALSGGTYGSDGYTGGTQEERGLESTIGNLVADALESTPIAALGERRADLGIVNPGGLRADLLFAGDTEESPENTEGVVTFEEANSVLPFVNNIYYVDVTGAVLEEILEQQWQPAGSSRPFLHLGLSSNVDVVLDPSRPEGERVRSITIDGEPVDRSATYTISTFSFLAQGGDNFEAFTKGTSTDTGAIDRDLWIDGFWKDGGAKSPSFEQRQVFATVPATVRPGAEVSFEMTRLGLLSLGAPEDSLVTATLGDEVLGTFPVVGGTAAITFTVPSSADRGDVITFASERGATVTTTVARAADKARATVAADGRPRVLQIGKTPRVKIIVTADGVPASGTVKVVENREAYRARLRPNGRIWVKLPAYRTVGKKSVWVKYLGDEDTRSATTKVKFRVVKKK
ncbi:bifunctional metallophosphatase/5'-nucleotidase [Nocardioides sp. SYSU DS0663]|uniref:bifunctional metallophosphatase/5'-nucleotidase n=1 Tax=Nocardioides sp. SYSU DS0663 TaxID=3416445 RepID=UPI003F4BB941